MKPAPFDYVAPTTLDDAVRCLAKGQGEAKILAGGQSLMPILNMRLARPEQLIDLGRIPELDSIREENGRIHIGAMTTKRSIERSSLVAERQPLLLEATRNIAHPQIRNRGTLGGSLAHADPAAEYPAVARALDAELYAKGPSGQRTIAAADFFVTYLTTALEADEILVGASFPVHPEGHGWAFEEISRRHGDFAMTGVALTCSLAAGIYSDVRIVLFGVAPTPLRPIAMEERLRGQAPSEALHREVASAIGAGLDDPLSDTHASADYRRQLATVVCQRALDAAALRAT